MLSSGGEEDSFVLMGIGPNQNAMLMELLNGRKLSKGDVLVYEALPFYRLYNTELAVTFSLGPDSATQERVCGCLSGSLQSRRRRSEAGCSDFQGGRCV